MVMRGNDGKDYFSREEIDTLRKVTDALWANRKNYEVDEFSALQTLKVPVGRNCFATVEFSHYPTADELDRLAAHIMFYKELAPKTRPDILSFYEAFSIVAANTSEAIEQAKALPIQSTESSAEPESE